MKVSTSLNNKVGDKSPGIGTENHRVFHWKEEVTWVGRKIVWKCDVHSWIDCI
jgi:hypothetical protein